MTVISVLEWLISSNTIITAWLLVLFAFGLFYSLIIGGNKK